MKKLVGVRGVHKGGVSAPFTANLTRVYKPDVTTRGSNKINKFFDRKSWENNLEKIYKSCNYLSLAPCMFTPHGDEKLSTVQALTSFCCNNYSFSGEEWFIIFIFAKLSTKNNNGLHT